MSITRSVAFVLALASPTAPSFASPQHDVAAAQHRSHATSTRSAFIETVRQTTPAGVVRRSVTSDGHRSRSWSRYRGQSHA